MKYGIIAAGEGSRLAKEGVGQPKPLVEVCGQPLIDRLMGIFADNDATEIVVICNDITPLVSEHLEDIEKNGLPQKDGSRREIPLCHIVKTTPSSMHSFYELSRFFEGDEPFVLTTVDTIFKEEEFSEYVSGFVAALKSGNADGMMGVTDYIDDESPLYVATDADGHITGFLDKDPDGKCRYISGGIYGLTSKALLTLQRCMDEGQSRMRNFQRGLIADGLRLEAHCFSKVLDIDHASDIQKAEEFLSSTTLTAF